MNPQLTDSLISLITAGHRCVRVVTTEEDEAVAACVEAAMAEDAKLLIWSAVHGVYDGLLQGSAPVPGTENAAAGLFHLWRRTERTICVTLDLAPHLCKDDRTLRAWRDLLGGLERAGSTLVMVEADGEAPPIVKSHSTLLEPPLPGEEAIEGAVRATMRELNRERPVTADLTRDQLSAIVKNLRGLTRRQVRQCVRDAVIPDRTLSIADLPTILLAKRRAIEESGVLEFVESPASMDQIGGLGVLKAWLARRAVAFREDAAKLGLAPPRGVLLLGVQGAGKSLCCKAVATAWNRPLLRLDAGALYDRYIGESERRLRTALRQAELMAPCVLWIDEIEKAFASAASTSSDGGLSRRMFGTLLTWMQEHRAPVFLAATANDIQALPPELLRKGRFDEIFFVDLPGVEARAQILAIHLRRRGRAPGDVDVARLAAASEGHSGAEIEQAIVSAAHDALAENRPLTTEMLELALRASPPLSVTMRESIEELRAWARGRCVMAE